MGQSQSRSEELTAEWRQDIKDRLGKQDEQLQAINEALTNLMINSSSTKALGELEARVRELEKFQVRALAVVATSQVAIAIVWALIVNFVFKK